jgi:hypothetical protein
MKIIISESQYKEILSENNSLRFRRVYSDIQNYFLRKMENYIPCNYNYEDGAYDFYNDIKNYTIESFLYRIYGIEWGDGDNETYYDLYDELSDMLFQTEFEYVKSYYNDWIKEHCPNKKF